MPNAPKKMEVSLKGLGFTQPEDQADLFVLSLPGTNERSDMGWDAPPYVLSKWQVGRYRGEWWTESIDFILPLNSFVENLSGELKSHYGSQTTIEVVPALDKGAWVFIEFTKDKLEDSKKSKRQDQISFPHGTLGFQLNMVGDEDRFSIHLSNQVHMGYTPDKILCQIPKMIMKCLRLDKEELDFRLGLFESSVSIDAIIQSIAEGSNNAEVLQELGRNLSHPDDANYRETLVTCEYDSELGFCVTVTETEDELMNLDVSPMEIIETHDLGPKYRDLDKYILNSDLESALKICTVALKKGDHSLFICRRLCIINMWQSKVVSDEILEDMLHKDSSNLLFLSAAAQGSLRSKNMENLLNHLSELGELLKKQMTEFDDLNSIEVVLPELLGDSWSNINPETAQICYQRVVQRRGDMPRVLNKMIQISRSQKDFSGEASLLNRLIEVENKKAQKADSFIRLSEIYYDSDSKLAMEYAVRAWKLCPNNEAFAIFAADRVCDIGEHQKAIRILDDSLRLLSKNSEDEKIAKIELKIAHIWFHSLGRGDLAELRVEHAFELGNQNLEILFECKEVATSIGALDILMLVQESLFFYGIEHQKREMVFDASHALKKLYKRSQGSETKIAKLYHTLVEHYLLSPDELEYMLSIPKLELDWPTLLKNIEDNISQGETENRQSYYTLLGNLAVKKLKDFDLACRYYETALEFGIVEPLVYDFLNEYYLNLGLDKKRDELRANHLSQTKGARRKEILIELFSSSKTLSESEIDRFAIMLLLEFRDDGPAKTRLMKYQDQMDLSSISKMLESIKVGLNSQREFEYWQKYIIEIVSDVDDVASFDFVEDILQSLKPTFPNTLDWNEYAISLHRKDSLETYLKNYALDLVLAGMIPEVEKDRVIHALSNESEALGIYYKAIAINESNQKAKSKYLRQSISLLSNYDEHKDSILHSYTLLCSIDILNPKEIEVFYELAISSNCVMKFSSAMEGQLKILKTAPQFRKVKPGIVRLIEANENTIFPLVKVYIEVQSKFQNEQLFKLYRQLFATNRKYSEFIPLEWGYDFIDATINVNQDFNYFVDVLIWLLENDGDKGIITQSVKMAQQLLLGMDDIVKLKSLVHMGMDYGMSFPKILWEIFTTNYRNETIDEAMVYWGELVTKTETVKAWTELAKDTKELISDDEWAQFIENAIKLEEKCNPEVFDQLSLSLIHI